MAKKKIALIGAGSVVFCKTLLSDMMATPALADSEFALMNRTEPKLRRMENFANRMIAENGLPGTVWGTLDQTSAIDGYRRALQRAHLERLEYLMTEQPASNAFQGTAPVLSRGDVRPLVRAQLVDLKADVDRAARRIRHRVTRAHLQDIIVRIDAILEAEEDDPA